jgi:lysophospholipase L1-like esterase
MSDPPPKRVLVYGDSNAWGFWVPDAPGVPLRRIPFAQRWAGVAQAALGTAVEVLEDALPGRLAEGDRMLGSLEPAAFNGAKRLAETMVKHMPLDLVVLALGTNDLLADPVPPAEEVCARLMRLAGMVGQVMLPAPLEGMPAPARVLVLSPIAINPNAADRADPARSSAERARLAPLLAEACASSGHAFADGALAVQIAGIDGVHIGPAENAALGALAATAIAQALA